MGETGFHKILVGYDGSEDSEKAADLAVALAKKFDATVVVCHAFGHMPLTYKPSEVRRLVNPLLERLSKLGITAQVATPDVVPAQGILDSADEHRADLIVLGSRGRGTFANLLLGSTAERVLRYSKVPVLIAR
jgi:nucleotide-binding universal stress UspA family protein